MRLNEFGKKARLLRMDLDLSLKQMAEAMAISSAHLSALEYGDKKLSDEHIDRALSFLARQGAPKADLDALREAGAKSMDSVSTKDLSADARAMVYAFARKLQENGARPTAVDEWLKDRK